MTPLRARALEFREKVDVEFRRLIRGVDLDTLARLFDEMQTREPSPTLEAFKAAKTLALSCHADFEDDNWPELDAFDDAMTKVKLPGEPGFECPTGEHDFCWGTAGHEMERESGSVGDLVEALRGIADAKPSQWDPEVRDQFREWAQSVARAALAKAGKR
jgi:hypothetical protein